MNPPNTNVSLTKRQAERLATLSGIPVEQLREGTIAELAERYKFVINPHFWLFERVCGRVVKTDPVTGIDYPVPYATVHIQDNDCNFIGFFPTESKWSWFYPFRCHREDLGTTTTDACGYFCAWILRFDIDWILEWRREHFCFPEIFVRPSIRDILNNIEHRVELPPVIGHPPLPDPPPSLLSNAGQLLRQVQVQLGNTIAQKLVALETSRRVGDSIASLQELLDSSAYPTPMPPPLTKEHIEHFTKQILPEAAAKAKVKLSAESHAHVQPRHFIGPFYRCFDVFFPEWVPIFGVPDITFEVTQDVNGNGSQEVIYSESYFDIRWDATSIPPVTLHASQVAVTSLTCDVPEVSCEGGEPDIQFAGMMPLRAGYHDNTNVSGGYALRPNRPHPSGDVSGLPSSPSQAPYAGTLNLFGCYRIAGGAYYRILYSLNGQGSVPFTPSWYDARSSGTTFVTPDASGWYSYLPQMGDLYDNHMLNWETSGQGLYSLTLQIADAGKNIIYTAPTPTNIYVDDTAPTALFTALKWRVAGTSAWTDLDLVCPVIRRPAGQDIEVYVTFNTWASHFRSVQLSAGGCDATEAPVYKEGSTEHWYTSPPDNNYSNAASPAIYTVPGSYEQGSYGLSLFAVARAFNPSGDSTALANDWFFDPAYIWVAPSLSIAIVNQ